MKIKDIAILRELAKRYSEISQLPEQNEKRQLWKKHYSLKKTRTPIILRFGFWNAWCAEMFKDENMTCEDPFYRSFEKKLKVEIFHYENVGDDFVHEPWVTLRASINGTWNNKWGVDESMHGTNVPGEAASYDPPIKDWNDVSKLHYTPHYIDEAKTKAEYQKLSDAIGDIITINVDRSPVYINFSADISTSIAKLRGLEQLMMDMYDYPQELHRLLAFMRDGILKNNQEAEDAGDYTLTSSNNQGVPYAEELEPLRPNSNPVKRNQIWGFFASQEYTLISPEFHYEFLFQYQLPIMEKFGLVHYGCCENLTNKIDMLRKLKNLRSIAVTPTANLAKSCEQIGKDYVVSWRPNPSSVICCAFDEDRTRQIISKGFEESQGTIRHVMLKDIETLEGDISRLRKCVEIIRKVSDKMD